MQYSQYLQTEHWKNKRQVKLADKPLCQICKASTGLHIHHKRYKDKERNSVLFNEKLSTLITLCGSCHRLMHHYFGIEVHKINKKICRIRRLMELGAIKKMAFYFASQDQLFISAKIELENMMG